MFEDEDRGFGGPMYMVQMMMDRSMMLMGTMMLVYFALYAVLRWRDSRAPSPDPQLGLKYALHFFRLSAFQLLLAGTAMLLFSMLGKDLGESREDIYRPAFGFLVPAGVVFGVATVMLGKTNNYTHPNVARLFNGLNLLITGIIGFAVFVMAFQLLFAKGKSGNPGRMVWSGVLVYTTAWAALGAMFARQVMDAPPPPLPPTSYGPGGGGGDRPEPMQRPLA
jgi:hypothetical protein